MTVVDDGLVMARILQEDYLEAISLCQEKGCREFNKTQVKTRKRKKKLRDMQVIEKELWQRNEQIEF